jgi:adenylyltransferase/sulfurtransferase
MFGSRQTQSGAPVRSVSVHSAHDLMQQGVPMVDVREAAELIEASVPGAVHVPLSEIERDGAAALERCGLSPPDCDTVLLFCRSGNRSGIAARLLAPAFGDRLVNVEGGILAWAARGLPLKRGR